MNQVRLANDLNSKMKGARLAFSSFEVRLMDERERKNAEMAPFNSKFGERCRELVDAADEMTRRLYCVVDWLALHPEYNPKTKVIPKKDYPVLVDVTF